MEALFSNHKRNQHNLESRLTWLSQADARADATLDRWNKEIELRNNNSLNSLHFKTQHQNFGEADREKLSTEIVYSIKKSIERRAIGFLDAKVEIEVGNYRGFDVIVYAQHNKIQFKLTGIGSYEPENLCYQAEDKFSLNGWINRMANFLAKFEVWKKEAEDSREKERGEYLKAQIEINKPFPQLERLETLRQDVRDIMTELKLMQADDTYVSQWQPKSLRSTDKERPEKLRLRMG